MIMHHAKQAYCMSCMTVLYYRHADHWPPVPSPRPSAVVVTLVARLPGSQGTQLPSQHISRPTTKQPMASPSRSSS